MAREGPLPNFIVIGAMRAGTTTLYHHLSNHPDIGMSRMKETDFFVSKMNYSLGLDWYRSQFDPGFACHGEVSPNYGMCHLWEDVPALIQSTLPDVKLVFLARDPVDRFFSHYLMAWHVGYTQVPPPEELLGSQVGRNILLTSSYEIQIKAYLEHFHQDQMIILDFDELIKNPQTTTDRVTDFLGLDRHPVNTVATQNDIASAARLPGFVQRAWRSRHLRRLDRFISRDMRNRARRLLSAGPRRPDPEIGPELRAAVTERLAGNAEMFRQMTGMEFSTWKV